MLQEKYFIYVFLSFALILMSCTSVTPVAKDEGVVSSATSKPRVISIPDTAIAALPYEDPKPLLKPEEFVLKYDKIAEIVRPLDQGKASWYGPNFHGRLTASGEPFNMHQLTAAHPSLPFNTLVWVENKKNGRGTLVRINDRGPYANNRVIDVSRSAARELGMVGHGVTEVQLFIVKKGAEPIDKQQSFTIQLGAFKRGIKAVSYAQKLRGARVEIFYEHAQKFYGVFYGQYSDLQEAFRQKKKLEEKKFIGHIRALEIG